MTGDMEANRDGWTEESAKTFHKQKASKPRARKSKNPHVRALIEEKDAEENLLRAKERLQKARQGVEDTRRTTPAKKRPTEPLGASDERLEIVPSKFGMVRVMNKRGGPPPKQFRGDRINDSALREAVELYNRNR